MTYGYIVSNFETLAEDERKDAIRNYIRGLNFNERGEDELRSLFAMELRKAKAVSENSKYYLDLSHTNDKEGAMYRKSIGSGKKERQYRFNEFRSCFESDLL